ncbi:MAG: DASS family sodium-coupled anion symporter [Thermoplasmata archaeon]|nr:DASS family sodium-coupled anion symporter [Thermoplasmata archaeon]
MFEFNRGQLAKLALPFLLLLIVISIPRPEGLTVEGQMMFGVLICAASLFILQPIPLGLSGIVVLILPLILGATNVQETFRSFGNSAVFFLIGAFMIAATVERTPLHRKLSLRFLRLAGSSPRLLVLATMLSGASLTFIMPEHGVIVLIVPILVLTIIKVGLLPLRSNLARSLMIGAAYGCTIGSLATPLGGARNPLTIGFLNSQGIEMGFLRWMVISMPIVVISIFAVWIILILMFPTEVKDLKMAAHVIKDETDELPTFKGRSRIIVLTLILIVLCFVILPYFINVEISLIALIGGVVLFIVGGMKWEDVEAKIPWGIILLYGGAISMGIHLANSGAATWLADRVLEHTYGYEFLSILLVLLLSKVLTEVMSNTAAVSIMLPIGYAVFSETGLPAEMGAMLVGLSGGLAFMFLISTPGNLISYSSGYFTQKDLLKAGSVVNVVTIGIVLLVAYTYWKWIGVW